MCRCDYIYGGNLFLLCALGDGPDPLSYAFAHILHVIFQLLVLVPVEGFEVRFSKSFGFRTDYHNNVTDP